MWKDPECKRTDEAEIEKFIQNDKIIIAYRAGDIPEEAQGDLS